MKFIRIKEDVYVNPEMVVSIYPASSEVDTSVKSYVHTINGNFESFLSVETLVQLLSVPEVNEDFSKQKENIANNVHPTMPGFVGVGLGQYWAG